MRGRGLANRSRVEARSAKFGSRERLRGVALRWRSYLAGENIFRALGCSDMVEEGTLTK